MSNFKYEIKKELGVLGDNTGLWVTKVNIISWNGNEPKLDIRKWNTKTDRMGKGISISMEESQLLNDILNSDDLLEFL